MLPKSQPLDPKVACKLGLADNTKPNMTDGQILSQRIGTMLDDFQAHSVQSKPDLKTHIGWRLQRMKDFFHNVRYTFRNHRKWHKTMRGLRPWEGFDGLIRVMQTQLRDFVENEERHGHSAPECRGQKIASAKETIKILERIGDPDGYIDRPREEVNAKYPAYQSLITKHSRGTSFSGKFIAQGMGWAGIESGKNPRDGYFEFRDSRFEMIPSPDQAETNRLLDEIRQYHKDLDAAHEQAEVDSNRDFERLADLLQGHLYTWWD